MVLASTTRRDRPARHRRGVISVLSAFLLALLFAFVAFSVDTGRIVYTQTNLQNAADAAALAASHELTAAVHQAAQGEGEAQISTDSQAVENARQIAVQVAAANGALIDPNSDVLFGKRSFDEAAQTWPIQWGVEPYNVVKVIVRRDHPDISRRDGRLPLSFGWAVDRHTVEVAATAAAFVEARDIALVLDFSGSMNYDSQFRSDTVDKLGQTALEANLYTIWRDLGSPTYGNLQFEPQYATVTKTPGSVTWPGSSVEVAFAQSANKVRLYFRSGGYQTFSGGSPGQTKTYEGSSGKLISKVKIKVSGSWTTYDFFSTSTIKAALGLNTVTYPYPQGSWNNYIDYCRDSSNDTSWYDREIYKAGYRRKFGMKTLVEFWIKHFKSFDETPDLWKTHHYPFHAVKEGASLLCSFLKDLDYGDHLGLVTYDTNSRIETALNESGQPTVNLGSEWLTRHYSDIDTIQKHKQAAHYGNTTNIGGGLDDSIQLLVSHGRYGARPTIILMTDGNANVSDSSWSLPSDWNWATECDYDGDGTADYSSSNQHARYAIGKAKEAADRGFTVHSMAVGANADRGLLRAIAYVGGGTYIDIPGGKSVSQMEADVRQAFAEIAAELPPPKLVYEH